MFKKIGILFIAAASLAYSSIEEKRESSMDEGYLVHRVEDNLFLIDEEEKMVAIYSEDFKPMARGEMQELLAMGQVIEGNRRFFKSYSEERPEAVAFSNNTGDETGVILVFEDIRMSSDESVGEILDIFEIGSSEREELLEKIEEHRSYL